MASSCNPTPQRGAAAGGISRGNTLCTSSVKSLKDEGGGPHTCHQAHRAMGPNSKERFRSNRVAMEYAMMPAC